MKSNVEAKNHHTGSFINFCHIIVKVEVASLKAYLRYYSPRKKYKPEGDVTHRVWHISLRLPYSYIMSILRTLL